MKDFTGYVKRLEAAEKEKLFWLDKIDFSSIDYFIDFGAGSGICGKAVLENFPHIKVIFYDKDKKMRNLLLEKFADYKNAVIEDDVALLRDAALFVNNQYAICFSSVLHEIDDELYYNLIIKHLIKASKYTIIRDMYYGGETYSISDIEKIVKLSDDFRYKSFFDNKTKNIGNDKFITEYLLKYFYIENWETELKENYFSTPWNKIKTIAQNNFTIILDCRYTIPFITNRIKNQFDIDLHCPTHRNLILKRIGE